MIRSTRTALPALAVALWATAASAQQATPSDNELRSAYCAAVLKGQITWVKSEVIAKIDSASASELQQPATAKMRKEMQQWLSKLQAALDRIMAYLNPRATTLDPAAMLMAMNRGDADWQEFMAKGGNADEALGARIRACADPNWLPF